MSSSQPGRGSDQFPLRFPDGMRQKLKDAAADNGRSLNAEIIHRLELSLNEQPLDDDLKVLFFELQAKIDQLDKKLQNLEKQE